MWRCDVVAVRKSVTRSIMKNLRYFSFVLVLLVLVGCSKSEQKPSASAGTGAPSPEFNAISDIPVELRSDLESFAKQFESDCRKGDTNTIRGTLDMTAVTDSAFDGIQANEGRLGKFKSGFKEGLL